ncbi:MAG TPA: hypothetical protein VE868_07060 [Balneolaceae bacterium]|nr:hypothetical protein [Balneolaceae bacterium]
MLAERNVPSAASINDQQLTINHQPQVTDEHRNPEKHNFLHVPLILLFRSENDLNKTAALSKKGWSRKSFAHPPWRFSRRLFV